MESATAFAPATVSNVACGFDVLGFALEAPGDEVSARFSTGGREPLPGFARGNSQSLQELPPAPVPQVRIDDIVGDGGRLPRDPGRNTSSVAAQALLVRIGERRGVALTIRKGLPLSSGLGGSAASAVASVVAVDALIGSRLSLEALMACAFDGERLGAGSAHGDNIAPARVQLAC